MTVSESPVDNGAANASGNGPALGEESWYLLKCSIGMGNVLNLSSAPQHSHPEHMIYQSRIHDYQFELWSILICRAIMEYIRCKLIYEKGIENNQFSMWTILLCRNALAHISAIPIYRKAIADAQFMLQGIRMFKSVSDYVHKQIYVKGIIYDQFQLWVILLWRAVSGYIYCKPIYKKGLSLDQSVNLPEDVQCIILSKLPLKEAARTSVLSSKWRSLWTICPKLRFDGTVMFGQKMNGKQREQYVRQFIDAINAVLQQFHGKVVEELVIKYNFDSLLVDHLNNWFRFAASSHTKLLALDLTPRGLEAFDDPQYIFPFHLFGSKSVSHLQLRFVSVKLHTQFGSFPKLRKLDLHIVKVTAKDLQNLFSNSCIVHCKMDGELKVDSPLPSLQYLNVAFCGLTNIEFRAVKLRTFVYSGSAVSINLTEASELKNANISFTGSTIAGAIPVLANVLANVQNLSFKVYVHPPEVPCFIENPCRFSHLKHLQLLLSYSMDLDVDSLSLISFLGTALFIEKLEIHFSSLFGFYLTKGASIRRFQHKYNYLKDVCITGFQASRAQSEFLVHIVENTPALEVLTIDPLDRLMKGDPLLVIEREGGFMDAAYRIVREYIEENVSPKCSLRLLF